MDKRLILAVAGSGKTTTIVNKLSMENKSLIITYTNNNFDNIRKAIIKKFGLLPANISIYTYFSFIYKFCYKPFLSTELNTKGLNFNKNSNMFEKEMNKKSGGINLNYYLDGGKRLYSNRISKLLLSLNLINEIKERLEKYFEYLFIDEIQDIAGNDFNFLMAISSANLNMLFVGDFYQHTYDTSRDGNVNKGLYDDYGRFVSYFRKIGFIVDTDTLNASFRCSPNLCGFIREKVGIEIYSHGKKHSEVKLINSSKEADDLFSDSEIVKLFFSEHYRYPCKSQNWGESKGENEYVDVCVVLNKTTMDLYNENKLSGLKPQSRNKFYVACSRANGNLYLVSFKYFNKYKRSR